MSGRRPERLLSAVLASEADDDEGNEAAGGNEANEAPKGNEANEATQQAPQPNASPQG